jgi:hypothetical protein
MEEDKVLVALEQIHDDMKELIGVIRTNYQGVLNQNTKMIRLYVTVITVAFISYFFYPWIYNHIFR